MNQKILSLSDPKDLDTIIATPYLRLNHLYQIATKRGTRETFKLNWAQQELHDNLWYCNIILKARQLGISTFICLLFLDRCVFNSNMSAAIIAHTREDSERIFKRIKMAYDFLPASIKLAMPAEADSARELVFKNGSSICVGTSMRSSTLQYLHISEFGKICAKFPEKAEEIITGALNTVAPGQYCFIESTAEGRSGPFYDMCKEAQEAQIMGKPLSQLNYKFHFFPWWKEPGYRIGSQVHVSEDDLEYFDSLQLRGILIDQEQKYWYSAKHLTQGDNMMREYPSTPEEAFQSARDGAYYSKQMALARVEKRITRITYDDAVPVHTAWDLGYNDLTSIWFFQIVGKEIHVLEYLESCGESLSYWIGVVKAKRYVYDKHLAPHDIMAHEYTSGMTRQASARKLGFNLIAVPKTEIIQGIDAARSIFSRCWFDEVKCEKGLKALDNYKKEWNPRIGDWNKGPLHDQYSHGADAFRTLATGIQIVSQISSTDGRTLGYKPIPGMQNPFMR